MSEPWVVSDDPAAIHWPEAQAPVTLCGQATRGRRVADAEPAVTCSWCIGLLSVAGVLPRSPAALVSMTPEPAPATIAGPAFARAIAEHIDRPVPAAAAGQFMVEVYGSGAVTVWYPQGGLVRLDGDSDTAKNIRGLLLALVAGAIA